MERLYLDCIIQNGIEDMKILYILIHWLIPASTTSTQVLGSIGALSRGQHAAMPCNANYSTFLAVFFRATYQATDRYLFKYLPGSSHNNGSIPSRYPAAGGHRYLPSRTATSQDANSFWQERPANRTT